MASRKRYSKAARTNLRNDYFRFLGDEHENCLVDSVIEVSPGSHKKDKDGAGIEPSKSDLLRILASLECELQQMDASIASLQADKAKLIFYQAKYGRFGLGDSMSVLQQGTSNQGESELPPAQSESDDSQLKQLENLIVTQRKAWLNMAEQMAALEVKFQKSCEELEEERRKHELDSAEGDDVLAGLGKERERLMAQVEYERSQRRRHEKELKKLSRGLEDVTLSNKRQKEVSLELLKDKKRLAEAVKSELKTCTELEKELRCYCGDSDPSDPSLPLEKQKHELRSRLQAEACRTSELQAEAEKLKALLAAAQQSKAAARPRPDPPVRRTPETTRAKTPVTVTQAPPPASPSTRRTPRVSVPADSGIPRPVGGRPSPAPSASRPASSSQRQVCAVNGK